MNLSDAIEIVGHTDPGMVRSHNEDSIANDARHGIAILADGMGGYNAGEVASGMATTVLMTELQTAISERAPFEADPDGSTELRTRAARMLREQIAKANHAIFSAALSQPQYSGMGTTVVAGLFYDNHLAVAHVGDSRMYRLRGEVFESITRDHSLLQEQIDAGLITPEQAAFSVNKNLVTRAVGVEDTVLLETHQHEVLPDDLYLMCSDGLSDMLPDAGIGQLLMSSETLEGRSRALIAAANEAGGKDNISVIVVRASGGANAQTKSWWPFRR